jgi:hypothetical protein
MRAIPAAWIAVVLAAGAAPAAAQSQPQMLTPNDGGQDNSVIAVPPAPPIVASPPSPAMPPAIPAPAPPGLVQSSPPPDAGSDNSNAGSNAAIGGNPDNGAPPNSDDGSASPAPDQAGPGPAGPGPAGPGPAPATAGSAAGGSADTAQDQDAIPTPANTWQPGKLAEISVLDKIDGGVKEFSVPVGGQSVVGDLQVSVLACVTRPPDQVPDAAVFLALQSTENTAAPPDYRGWLLRSEPGAAVAGDASEIFRIIDCL